METTEPHRREALIGAGLIVLGAIGFSAKSILIKLVYADSPQVDAITLMALRMLMSLPFFLAVALYSRGKSDNRHFPHDRAALLLLGVMGYYLASLLDFTGLEYISAGLERLILFLYPTFVVLLTAVFYRQPVAVPQRRALLLSYTGILLVYGFAPATTSADTSLGTLLVLGSALTFALFLVGSGHVIVHYGSRRFTAYTMSVACVATLLHFVVSKPISQLAVSGKVFGLAVILALVSTVAPAFLMNAGLHRIGAARASIVATIGPVSTLVMAYLLLGERLDLPQILGAAMVMGGVALVSLTKQTAAASNNAD
jgi:drug/metabolite transporter (DMT)-like permease